MLTSPSNRGRDDLRCPMGCRQEHARRERTRLSAKYYRTPEGREKKRGLNAKRSLGEPVVPETAPKEEEDSIASYLRSVLSMIEGRRISIDEIEAHMKRWEEELRQYSLADTEKIGKLPDD